MQNTANERFKKIVNSLKTDGTIKSQADLAIKLGYQTSYLSDLANGRFEFSDKFAKKLEDRFAVNSNWLLTGEGEMIKSDTVTATSDNENVTIPRSVWQVIEDQAASLKAKDQQTSELIALLKEQMKKGEDVAESGHVAPVAAQG